MSEALAELYRHKTWATLRLIEACAALDERQLAATAPGTYGSILATLQHLVAAEESYFGTATGEFPADPLTQEPATLAELAARISRLGPRWLDLAADPASAEREVVTGDGWRGPAAVAMAQALHHAEAHRSHVLTVLGARGIELPGLDISEDLDVWHHAIDTGIVWPDAGHGAAAGEPGPAK
jgi:uncharacterized damage-inducible protein DinB